MALLKDMFAKRPYQPPQQRPSLGVPVEKVLMMREQGLSNNQIVEALQREGFTLDLINNAVNQADIKEGVLTPTKGDTMQEMPPPMPGPMPQMPGQFAPMPPPTMQMQGMEISAPIEEKIQEIAEAIIDEKWSELIENVNRIVEWKDSTETRLARLDQQMKDLKDSFDKLHEGILGRISDYDTGIKEVGIEIKALEKVFQKVLPGFIDNVSELSRITQAMKGKPVVKK